MQLKRAAAALLLGLSSLVYAGEPWAKMEDCASDLFENEGKIGITPEKSSGGDFCLSRWKSGVLISGIEAWADDNGIQMMRMYYSDGKTTDIGTNVKAPHHGKIQWDSGKERIKELKLWGRKDATGIGRIYISFRGTDKVFDFGGKMKWAAVDISTGTGVMMAAHGKCGAHVDSLGFHFLGAEIKKTTITDIMPLESQEDLAKRKDGIETVLHSTQHYKNDRKGKATYVFKGEDKKKDTRKWTNEAMHTFGITYAVGVSGSLFGLVTSKVDWSLKYEYMTKKTEETAFEHEVMLGFEIRPELEKGEEVWCYAYVQSGKYKGQYHSKVNFLLENGKTYSFDQDGEMEQEAWSGDFNSGCSDKGPPDPKNPPEYQSHPQGALPPIDEKQVGDDGQLVDDKQPDDNKPEDGDQPPADGQQPPADGQQPPADGQQPPADGQQPPANDQQPPADGQQPPADGEQPPPQDGEQPPADGQQPPPQDGEQPPADGQQPPADGQQPPADDQQPPADGQQPPADDQQPPADGQQPPADGQQPPADGQQPPADGQQPPADGQQPPADGQQPPPQDGEQPPAGGQQPPADGQQPPADGQQPPGDGEQPPPQDGEQPPTDGQQPPPQGGEQPPADGQQPPADGQQPPADGQQPPADGQQPPAEEQPPPARKRAIRFLA